MKYLSLLMGCAVLLGCGGEGQQLSEKGQRPARSRKDKGDRDKEGRREKPLMVRVSAAALSADGKLALLGYYAAGDGQEEFTDYLKLWDARRGKVIRVLLGHQRVVNFVAFLPGGKRVVSGNRDGTLKIHNVETGKLLRSIRVYRKGLHLAVLSADGTLAFTYGAGDKPLKIVDLKAGKVIHAFDPAGLGPESLAISPDNRLGLTGCSPHHEGAKIELWNLKTGKVVRSLAGDKGWAGPVAFSPDGKYALATRRDDASTGDPFRHAALWDVSSGKLVWLTANKAEGLLFSSDGKRVFGRTKYGPVLFWDAASGKLLRQVKLDYGTQRNPNSQSVRLPARVTAFALSADGGWALAANGDNVSPYHDIHIRVWDLKAGKLARDWADPTFEKIEKR